jgi:hypothetical protein
MTLEEALRELEDYKEGAAMASKEAGRLRAENLLLQAKVEQLVGDLNAVAQDYTDAKARLARVERAAQALLDSAIDGTIDDAYERELRSAIEDK